MYNLGFAVFTLLGPAVGHLDDRARAAPSGSSSCGSSRASAARSSSPTRRAILTDAFPQERAGQGHGHQRRGRGRRLVHRADPGWVLAPVEWRLVFLVSVPFGLFGTVWAYLKLRDNGVRVAGRHRLGGQRHLRRRADPRAHRHHLRHPALRRPHHGMDQPGVLAAIVGGIAILAVFGGHRDTRRRPDVPAAAVPDPGLHRRQHRRSARRHRPRRPAVHADHLAAGHLAAPARLQLRADAAVGRHLHDPAHRRLPGRRPAVGGPVGPLRRPALRHRRAGRRGAQLPAARAAADRTSATVVRRC